MKRPRVLRSLSRSVSHLLCKCIEAAWHAALVAAEKLMPVSQYTHIYVLLWLARNSGTVKLLIEAPGFH